MVHYLIVQMCYKNNCGRFYFDLILKPSLAVLLSLVLEVYTGRTNQHTYIRNAENVI